MTLAMTPINIEWMKREAKTLKKETGLPHTTCLHKLAQKHGFKDWQALLRAHPQGDAMTTDQAQQPVTPPLAAMVYRIVGKGCRQYPFGSVDEFAAWAARKPYCNETLRVMPVKDYAMLGDRCLPAADAVAWVRQALGGAT